MVVRIEISPYQLGGKYFPYIGMRVGFLDKVDANIERVTSERKG